MDQIIQVQQGFLNTQRNAVGVQSYSTISIPVRGTLVSMSVF